MIRIDPTILIVMGEVMLALLVFVVGIVVYLIKLKKRDKHAAATLQGRLEDNVEKRQEMYEELITQTGTGMEGGEDVSKEMAQEWVDKENKFYNRLVEMYMQRNSTVLKSLDKLLQEHTSSYLDLITLMRERVDAQEGDIAEETKQQLERVEQDGQKLAVEVESLKNENQRLSNELEQAYAEIDQAMREYSQAFKPGGMTGSAVTAPQEKSEAPPPEAPVEKQPVEEKVAAAPADEISPAEPELSPEPEAESPAEPEVTAEPEPEVVPEPEVAAEPPAAAEVEVAVQPETVTESPPAAEAETETTAEPEPAVEPEVEAVAEPEAEATPESVSEPEPETVVKPEPAVESAAEPAIEVKEEIAAEPEVTAEPEVEPEAVAQPETEAKAEPVVEAAPEPEPETPTSEADLLREMGVNDEQSLEDVVLHAMAEESIAQQQDELAQDDSQAEEETGPRGPVIDLAKDEDILLSEPDIADTEEDLLGEALLEEMAREQGEQSAPADSDNSIDEDELLAQLASLDSDDESLGLEGFGEFSEEETEANKEDDK